MYFIYLYIPVIPSLNLEFTAKIPLIESYWSPVADDVPAIERVDFPAILTGRLQDDEANSADDAESDEVGSSDASTMVNGYILWDIRCNGYYIYNTYNYVLMYIYIYITIYIYIYRHIIVTQ